MLSALLVYAGGAALRRGPLPMPKGKILLSCCGSGPVADCCTVYLLLFRRCPADRGYGRYSEQHPELYGGYPGTLFVRQSRPHDAAQSYWLCAGVQRCAGGNSWQPRQRQPGGRCLYADRFGDFCTGRAVEQSRDPKGGFVHRLLPEPWGRRCGAAGHRPCFWAAACTRKALALCRCCFSWHLSPVPVM